VQTSIAVCNHAFHHNPKVWGENHDVFDPSRWDDAATSTLGRYLMHFGLGGRQCLGKTVAMTNIYKLTSTLLKEFSFELLGMEKNGTRTPELESVSVSDLKNDLMIRVTRRSVGR
jgi:cytochrome P450